MSTKVSIIVVTYNSSTVILNCLQSIAEQSFNNYNVIIIDNNSLDNTIELVREYFPQFYLIINRSNTGYAHANNQGISMTKSEYVLLLNPDVILDTNFLAEAVDFIDENKSTAGLAPKLKRFNFKDRQLTEIVYSNIIDSCGIIIKKNRRIIERGAGLVDKGQFERKEEVFGASGACSLWRRQALEAVKFRNEYLDESFQSYKEDIDLSWRLRLQGWSIYYLPTAQGYHLRVVRGQTNKGHYLVIARQHKKRNRFINYLSYRNHFYLLLKNELLINFIWYLPLIISFELGKLLYILLFERGSLKAWLDVLKNFRQIMLKRKYIMSTLKVKPEQIRAWFS